MELRTNSATESVLGLGRRLSKSIRTPLNALIDDLANLSSKTQDWEVMIFVGADIEVYRRTKGAPERLTVVGTDLTDEALVDLEGHLPTALKKRVSLRFSSERAVIRLIALPSSAEDVVGAIVRNKVESLAPWPLTEALWGFRRSDEPAPPGHINIEVGIIGRKQVEILSAWLARIGIQINQLGIAGSVAGSDAIEIDFRRDNKREAIASRIRSGMALAALGAAVCAGIGTYVAVSSLSELNEIEAQTTDLTNALHDQSASSGQGKLSEARKLIERKRTEQPAIGIIESLTRSIPNDAWLETLDYENHQLTVVGRGTSIPPIVEALEKSGVFSDVNFASPTQHDAVAKVDSFSISAAVQPQSVAQ
jgi:general secretion pathway protein L